MNQTAGTAAKKRNFPFLLQAIFILGVLVFIWFSFNSNVLESRQPKTVPENLGRMELLNKVEGTDAIAAVSRLHGTEIKLDNALIANYGYGGEKVTVWVGKTPATDAASELLEKMVSGITRGGTEFGGLQKITVGEQAVLKVNGPGGEHYFYQQDREVVWLAIQSRESADVLKLAIKVFQNY